MNHPVPLDRAATRRRETGSAGAAPDAGRKVEPHAIRYGFAFLPPTTVMGQRSGFGRRGPSIGLLRL